MSIPRLNSKRASERNKCECFVVVVVCREREGERYGACHFASLSLMNSCIPPNLCVVCVKNHHFDCDCSGHCDSVLHWYLEIELVLDVVSRRWKKPFSLLLRELTILVSGTLRPLLLCFEKDLLLAFNVHGLHERRTSKTNGGCELDDDAVELRSTTCHCTIRSFCLWHPATTTRDMDPKNECSCAKRLARMVQWHAFVFFSPMQQHEEVHVNNKNGFESCHSIPLASSPSVHIEEANKDVHTSIELQKSVRKKQV